MENFSVTQFGALSDVAGKAFVMEQLGLTGCEISISKIDAGQTSPFIHAHKENEEIFIFVQGSGIFNIDGHMLAVKEGSMVKVKPAGKRILKANNKLIYICIQVKENSLQQATKDDGIIFDEEASW